MSDSLWRDVCAEQDLKTDPGHVIQFDDIKRRVAIFRHSNGALHAVDDICPHAGASLGDGWQEGDKVVCPLHAWEFDLATGKCPYGDDWSVDTFPVRVHEGMVQVMAGPRD